jgi:histidinol-phosphate/aromatic aminotransferase/cobyric acid decarboxylase-like protein
VITAGDDGQEGCIDRADEPVAVVDTARPEAGEVLTQGLGLADPGEGCAQGIRDQGVNVLTQATAAFALRHKAVLDTQTQAIRAERGRLFTALTAIPGVHPYPSDANFILLRLPAGRADAVFAGLKRRGVLVKNLDAAHPMLHDCLRVTVGLPEENQAFLAALTAEC